MRAAVLLALLGTACSPAPISFVAITFNTGTTEGLLHDDPPDDGYTSAHATISDTYYGDGLAWRPAVEAARRFFAERQPDVVGFQEIFYSAECADIPMDAHSDFVCETWSEGDPTVAQTILGDGYAVACHIEKSDKCLAVKKSFGTIEGCPDGLCLDGLDGARVEGCGGGSRIGRARVRLADDDRTITVVNVHGSSGVTTEDSECRTRQFQEVFALADGERNVILGDLNTDPDRLFDGDESAATFARSARGAGFEFASGGGEPTYGGIVDIDHVLADFATGTCEAETIIEATYFDHRPIVCSLEEPE